MSKGVYMAVTIKDIAREAGLGTSTVSAYLNGVAVRAKNKAAIEAAIKKLGYIRNDFARGLKTHKSKTVGIIIPELSNTFGTTIIGSVEEVLSKSGYGILVCDYKATGKTQAQTVDFLLSKMVDALVVIMPDSADGSFLDAAVNGGIPVVVIDRLINRSDVVQIVINNREVSYAATAQMLEAGHKSIGIITGNPEIYTAAQRLGGYRDALVKSGCFNEKYIYDGGLSVEGGYLAMKQLLASHPEITGLFVTNYEMTVGAIVALNECGKKIGKDLSFVGFDNLDLSRVVTPRLATVNQPMESMGRAAGEILLKAIAEGTMQAQTISLSASFDEGESITKM